MNRIVVLIFLLIPLPGFSSEWKHLPNYNLHELHKGGMAIGSGIKRGTKVVGTSGLSWPDGHQAIVTTLELTQQGESWLWRCIDYFNKDMQQTDAACYELRK